jgi:hypothetical protein
LLQRTASPPAERKRDRLDELSAALHAAGVEHALYHDCIWITLPQKQGHVEIKSWSHQGRTAQLFVDPQWFSLGTDDGEFDGPPEAVIAQVAATLSKHALSLWPPAVGALD